MGNKSKTLGKKNEEDESTEDGGSKQLLTEDGKRQPKSVNNELHTAKASEKIEAMQPKSRPRLKSNGAINLGHTGVKKDNQSKSGALANPSNALPELDDAKKTQPKSDIELLGFSSSKKDIKDSKVQIELRGKCRDVFKTIFDDMSTILKDLEILEDPIKRQYVSSKFTDIDDALFQKIVKNSAMIMDLGVGFFEDLFKLDPKETIAQSAERFKKAAMEGLLPMYFGVYFGPIGALLMVHAMYRQLQAAVLLMKNVCNTLKKPIQYLIMAISMTIKAFLEVGNFFYQAIKGKTEITPKDIVDNLIYFKAKTVEAFLHVCCIEGVNINKIGFKDKIDNLLGLDPELSGLIGNEEYERYKGAVVRMKMAIFGKEERMENVGTMTKIMRDKIIGVSKARKDWGLNHITPGFAHNFLSMAQIHQPSSGNIITAYSNTYNNIADRLSVHYTDFIDDIGMNKGVKGVMKKFSKADRNVRKAFSGRELRKSDDPLGALVT